MKRVLSLFGGCGIIVAVKHQHSQISICPNGGKNTADARFACARSTMQVVTADIDPAPKPDICVPPSDIVTAIPDFW